jgi:hypothetical protein
MMRSFRRLLLVLMLLMVIPFQGVASTLTLVCEMSHGLSLNVSTHANDAQITPHHDCATVQSAQASSDEHSSLNLADVGLDDDHHAFSSDLHKNHLKHNTCCSSAASGAVASPILFLASPDSNCAEFTYISSLHLPPVLAGLDRPPRLTLV